MEPLQNIVYVSSAIQLLADTALEDILAASRRNNAQHGVTGVLLYNEGTFFQYIEGPPDGLNLIFDKIRRSPQHRGIIELLNEPASLRRFPTWYMGFFHPTASELLNLANQTWWQVAQPHPADHLQPAEGLTLLQVFCQNAARL